MKKLFLLTEGEWEYSIVGLFESEFEINYDFLKEKREEYIKSLGLDGEDCGKVLLDDYRLKRKHMVMVMGRDWKYSDPTEPLTWKEYLQGYKDKVGDLEIDFIQWLSDTGIMKPVDHEEVNL